MSRNVRDKCLGTGSSGRVCNRSLLSPTWGNVAAESELPGVMVKRVLVVDDDARVRQALSALIGATPGLVAVGEASSSDTTLRADEELSPDIVLLDVLLPDLVDGLEVLRHLVARGRAVIAVSIRGDLRAGALAAGAIAFVDKFAGPDALLRALRRVPLDLPPPGAEESKRAPSGR